MWCRLFWAFWPQLHDLLFLYIHHNHILWKIHRKALTHANNYFDHYDWTSLDHYISLSFLFWIHLPHRINDRRNLWIFIHSCSSILWYLHSWTCWKDRLHCQRKLKIQILCVLCLSWLTQFCNCLSQLWTSILAYRIEVGHQCNEFMPLVQTRIRS